VTWQSVQNLAITADNIGGETSGHKATTAFVVWIPNVPRGNPPKPIDLSGGAIFTGWITTLLFDICKNHLDSIRFFGYTLRDSECRLVIDGGVSTSSNKHR